jgi:hypothetical protein
MFGSATALAVSVPAAPPMAGSDVPHVPAPQPWIVLAEMFAKACAEATGAFAGVFEFLASEGCRHVIANLWALAVAVLTLGVRHERRLRERD